MPTVFSHAVVGLAASAIIAAPGSRARLALAAALCAVAPDLDVMGIWLGVPWRHVLGHRGLTHSLPFAAVLAAVVAAVAFRGAARSHAWLTLFLATASHGVLDAMTDGGSGVAFLAPFDGTRTFFPWRPIPVSPIGLSRFFSERGLAVLEAEVVLVWIPAALLGLVGVLLRRRRRG
jgi:inner membrane protein